MEFWTIEVLDGLTSAALWRDAFGDVLFEAAHTNQVLDDRWSEHEWGVVLELGFADESDWLRFRALPIVQATLDAVPRPRVTASVSARLEPEPFRGASVA